MDMTCLRHSIVRSNAVHDLQVFGVLSILVTPLVVPKSNPHNDLCMRPSETMPLQVYLRISRLSVVQSNTGPVQRSSTAVLERYDEASSNDATRFQPSRRRCHTLYRRNGVTFSTSTAPQSRYFEH